MKILIYILAVFSVSLSNAQTIVATPIRHTYIERMPEFPGDLDHYLSSSQKPIKDNNGKTATGTVTVTFLLDTYGHVQDTHISKTTNAILNNDAQRVANEMPAWKPAKQNGRPIDLPYTLNISYR